MSSNHDQRKEGFRPLLRRNFRKKEVAPPVRVVDAFTTESNLQKNTKVKKPPIAGVYKEQPLKPSIIRQWYNDKGLPIYLQQEASGFSLRWKVSINDLDYKTYLPVFFDALTELDHPYYFFAESGIRDMLNSSGEKTLDVLPFLIPPTKNALKTHHPRIIVNAMKAIQQLALCHDLMGVALIPYYKFFLPLFNLYMHENLNIGDEIHYGQRRREVIGELINETLEIFEKTAGPQAYHQIKKFIPIYESSLHNY